MDNNLTINKPAKHSNSQIVVYCLIIVIGLLSVGFLYLGQHKKVSSAAQNSSQLSKQLTSLKQNLTQLQSGQTKVSTTSKAAAPISTVDWKTYCDSGTKYCFKYPTDWTIKDNSADLGGGEILTEKIVTNPSETVSAEYQSDNTHDGGYVTAYIDSADSVTDKTQSLNAVCGYNLAFIYFQPFCGVVPPDSTTDLKVGQNSLLGEPMRLNSGTQLNINYSKQDLTTRDQAAAWFKTTDGLTAQAIAKSVYKQN